MNWVVLVPLSMRFASRTVSLSMNGSGIYLHPCWRRYTSPSGICWKQQRFIQANPHGAKWWSWSRTVPCAFVWISGALTHGQRTRTLCPTSRRPWKAWWGQHISNQWISSRTSGRLRWPWNCSSTRPSQWVTLGSTSLPTCCSCCVMHLQCSSISCRTPWGS